MNIVDAASGFQVVRLLAKKTSSAVIEAIEESWTSWGGASVTMVADVGPEFTSEEFAQWCESRSCWLHTIPVEAPWQNGMAERGGGTCKACLLAVCREHAVADEQTLRMAISTAVEGGNADINESGYSPNQRVLGRQPRMPGDVPGASRVGGVNVRLAEQPAAADPKSNFAVRLAILETARVAQMRLRFS